MHRLYKTKKDTSVIENRVEIENRVDWASKEMAGQATRARA